MLKQLLENLVLYFKPRWIKEIIVDLSNALAIPSVAMSMDKRGLVAEWICEKEKECIFFMNVLIYSLQYHTNGNGNSKDADFVLKTLFGKEGRDELFQAYAYHGKNSSDALSTSREQALAYTLAMHGRYEKLRELKEFNECAVMGSLIASRFNMSIKNGHDELAFIGLGNRAFTHIFLSDDFPKWIEATVYLQESQRVINKFMRGER